MDLEKTIRFIVEQQAQFSADIQVLKEQDIALAKQMQELNQAQLRQLETVNRLIDVSSDHRQEIREIWRRMDERDAAFDRRVTDTDRRLADLIKVVDGLARRS